MPALPACKLMFCSCPAAVAESLARTLVEERLAACVSRSAPLNSVYRWQGKIEESTEVQLLIKTTSAQLEAVRKRILELHPYELPEIIAVTVSDGHTPYLDWIHESISS